MSRGYETFEHTADIGIRAWGSNLAEVFEEAAKALFSVIVELDSVSPKEKFEINLEVGATGRPPLHDDLFFKWLKELLFLFDTKHVVFSNFRIHDLTWGRLSAQAFGERVDSKKHKLGREVKAITRHQFKLTKEKSRYLVEVILDI